MGAYFPLLAAVIFPFVAMALKRAMDAARDTYGVLCICNLAMALIFLPFIFRGAHEPSGPMIGQPLLAGFFFFLGQVAAFKSFQGELSIAIPVQGAKVLVVAFLSMLVLGQHVSIRIWIAAGLSVAAIYILQDRVAGEAGRKRRLATLIYSGLASVAFAAFDLTVQKWAPRWGAPGFGAWAFLFQALLSLSLLFFPGTKMHRYKAELWRWLILGAGGMALITLGLVLVIGATGNATQVNLLFNSRCVWGVLFVWLTGKWFGNREAKKSGRGIMTHRLEGAGLMMAAIVLALL